MACKVIKASALPTATLKSFTIVPAKDRLGHKGYNNTCNCYYWGYRPEGMQLLGLGAGQEINIGNYNLCVDVARNCPAVAPPKCPVCPVCPPATICPACPKCEPQRACEECPTCPDCPPMPPPGQTQPAPLTPVNQGGAYGPVLGFLLAALVVGGGGYFMYKGLKKKKR